MVLFYSTSLALRAERVCQQAGLSVKLIPTPRHLSSDCGMALRFHWPDRERVEAALERERVDVDGVHEMAERDR